MGKRTIIAAAVLALTATLALVPAALARGGDKDVEKSGACSGNARWELDLDRDDGAIEVEFEVDQNRVGKKWRVVLRHDGDRFFRHVRTTKAPSGSFEVERKVANRAGRDRITAKAKSLSSGQLCRASGRL